MTTSPIAPERLAPVLGADARPGSNAAGRGVHVRRGLRVGIAQPASSGRGSASAAPTSSPAPVTSTPSASGTKACSWCADHDGALRGFYNTCRHRGHELLEPGASRNLRVIKCPYHAWVYQLDGSLGAAPRFGALDGFDRADYPLVAARIEEWHGWVFVNPDAAAPSFADHVGNLDELLAPWEIERSFVAETHEYEVAANWKTITENYHECYHCPVDPPCAVRRHARRLRPELRPRRALGRGQHGVEGIRRDDVAHGGVRGRPDPRSRRAAATRGLLLRPVPEPADQPAPRLRHDPPDRAPRAGPHQGRMPVAVSARSRRAPWIQPHVRERVLGHHEP